MCLVRGRLLDPAEDPAGHLLTVEPQALERAGGDHRGQEAAHRLLGAAVGVVDQVGQRVEHRHGHARRDLDGHRGRAGAALARQVQRHAHVVAAHLARTGEQLLDAVLVDREALAHRVGEIPAAGLDGQRGRAGIADGGAPIEARLSACGHGDRLTALADRAQQVEAGRVECPADGQR